MAASFSSWVRKHPLLAFYILAFSITWLGWLPQAAFSRGLFPFDSLLFYILGGVGPLVATFIVVSILRGESEFGELFSPFLRWRVSPVWYGVALLGYPVLWVASLVWRGELVEGLAQLGLPPVLLTGFLVSFIAAIPESVAWRGFALPRFQARRSALVSSLIVGVLWALWHLPLLLNTNSVMSTYALVPYLVKVVAVSVIYTWIFNNTRGSLLLINLFHAVSNSVGPFAGIEQTVVFVLAAIAVTLVFGAAYLSRCAERAVEQDMPVSRPAATG